MRKAQKKEFFNKISEYASKKLTYLIDVENWENQELSEKCGIPQNRLSEIKNKKRAVTELWLRALIGGGIMTVADIEKNVALDGDEKRFLSKMKFYENKPLVDSIQAAIAEGIDVMDLIEKAREENKNQ